MNLSEKEIIDIIKNYYSDKNRQYAILLDGEWGSGKTYFIKNRVLKKIDNAVYISLYGVSSINDINKKIMYSMIDKKIKLGKKIKKGQKIVFDAYKSIAPAVSNTIGRPLPNIENIDFSDLISNFMDVSKRLIVFDDLERVSLPINDVLGCINDYVEHKGAKCIIVCNEKEIERLNNDHDYELKIISCLNNEIDYGEKESYNGSKDKVSIEDIKNRVNKTYNTENRYKMIKEKLIGKTIRYTPNIDDVIDSLIKEHKNSKEYHDYLKQHKKTLINLLKKDNCHNIRTIIFILDEYENIFSQICELNYTDYEKEFLELTFINIIHMSILSKNGVDINKKLNGLKYSRVISFDENNQQKISDLFTGFDFINNYLNSASLNTTQMKETLDYYISIEEENIISDDDPLKLLEGYWELDDEEIEQHLKQMIDDFHYTSKIFPKILRIISGIESIGLYDEKVKKIINIMEKTLNNQRVDYIDFHNIITDQSTLEIYNKYVEKLRKILKKNETENNSNKNTNILLSDNWGEGIYNSYAMSNIIPSNGFLNILDINQIIENIKKCNTKEIWYFKYTIDSVYRFENIIEFYDIDRKNMKLLIKRLGEFNKLNFGKTKKYAISQLEETLSKKINMLNKQDKSNS